MTTQKEQYLRMMLSEFNSIMVTVVPYDDTYPYELEFEHFDEARHTITILENSNEIYF